MNRIFKYCFLLVVAELTFFALRFLENKMKTVPEIHLGTCNPRRHKNLNCQAFFSGEKNLNETDSPRDEKENECRLEELVKDCSRLRFEHGYEDKPVSKEEMDFPVAFAIKMHKDSHQVERLLRTIYRPHNFYCIHVDSKATIQTFRLIKNVADCLKNVVVLTKRINVVYSSIRVVEVEFACMKRSLESGVKWKYYINLTGQEFVLRTNLELVKILKIFNGVNDVESYEFTQMHRVDFEYRLVNNVFVRRKINRKRFHDISLHKGSAYGLFSRDFVKFSLNDDVVKEFYEWLNTTFAPEETIWSTINRWPFAPGAFVRRDIRHDDQTHASKAVIWAYEPIKCHGKFVRGICIFSVRDLPWLRSRPEIAANKFYESYDSVVLDCLEEWVNNKAYSLSLQELNWFYYRNLPQVKFYNQLKDFEKSREFLEKQKKMWLS